MRLLGTAWKIIVGIKDALVLIFMLLFFWALYMALTAFPNPALPVSDGALHLDLDGVIVEQPSEPAALDLISGRAADATREFRLRDVIRALDTAAADDRITSVALDLDGFLGGGQSALGEVGEALDRVRAADKPVIAYATGYADDGYLLAAHASEVWVHPMGGALITGPGGTRLYYGQMLENIGVKANVFRVGTYKSAVEPFTQSEQSPAAREADQALADTLFELWRENVQRARPAAQLDRIIATPADAVAAAGNDLSRAARDAHLVDQVGTRVQWADRVAEVSGEGVGDVNPGFRAVPLANWIAANPPPTGGSKIGVITVAGTIVDGEAGPGTAGGATIARQIEKASETDDFKALVIRVDSPGGSVFASEQIRQAILEAARDEGGVPVVVSMGSVAASGGYWVSTPGTRIVAEPATITGSIGVFSIIPSFEGTLRQLAIGADGVETTPLSGEPDLFGGISPEAQRLFQAGTDDIYGRFVGLVSQARKLPPERVNEIAQGRVWAGATARQLGLVDRFGGLNDAIALAAELAGVDADDATAYYIEQEPSAWSTFFAEWNEPEEADSATQLTDPWTRLAPDPRTMLAQAAAELQLLTEGPVMQARCLECPVAVTARRRSADDRGMLSYLIAWMRG